MPLSLRRQEAKRAAIAEAEALERSGIAPKKATVSASRTTGKKASRTPVIPTSPADHYYISQSKRSPINIGNWVDKNEDDPAIRVSARGLGLHSLTNAHSGIHSPAVRAPCSTHIWR